MIHYNYNTNKHTNIQLTKSKRHALANHRHNQRINTIKDTLIRLAIVLAVAITLTVIYLTN